MTGGSTIIDIRAPDAHTARTAEETFVPDSAVDAPPELLLTEGIDPPSPWRIAGPVLLALVALGWVAGMTWLAWPVLPSLGPVALAQFVAALLIVPLLATVVWLAALRTSTAEAQRFGASARAMRAEADALQQVVAQLSTALENNRAQLAEQAHAYGDIGERTHDRFTAIGRGLSEEIDQADVHARALAGAADAAQSGLQVLLATLPRAQAETEAMTARLADTGLAAGEQAAALDARLAALAERGREAEAVAGGAAQKLAAHIQRMEATSDAAGARLEGVTAEMSGAVDALLDRTAHAIDQSRQGIAAQGDAMLAMVNASQAALDTAARESADSLAERIGVLEIVIDRIAQRLDVQRAAGAGLVDDLENGLVRVSGQLDALHAQGTERSQTLAASISALGGSADAMTESLRAGDAMATRAIGTAESLLIALDASAREIDETLPDALDRLDRRIAVSQTVVAGTKPELLALVTAAESTHDAIEAIAQVLVEQRRTVEQLSTTLVDTLTSGRAKADALGQMVEDTIGNANRFADEAAPRLLDALLRVRDTAAQAAERARETLAGVIPEAAGALEAASTEALRRAAGNGIAQHIAAIAEAADAAVRAAAGASDRLERQLQSIGEATALVEARIDDARAEREAADQDHFARRASLLIEALNSAAIDITRTFRPEVADSAWAAYLKGDRGVFTRRAVRLLDAGEQRDVHRLYDDDASFRDQVNRYIHDFEAMLRTILAQRDGSPLAVTLLSSDMGKLYVALAQAIERLR